MINRVVLVGRLTRDPELSYTQNGTARLTFTLAVNRRFANQQGEHEADFIKCVVWRKAAETVAQYVHKGSQLGVDGTIQTSNYTNDEGKTVYLTQVNVESFSFLDSKNKTEQSNNPVSATSSYKTESSAVEDPFDPNIDGTIDISSEDLPF